MELHHKLQIMIALRHIALLTLGFLVGCREAYIVPVEFADDPTLPNVTLGELREFYAGARLTISDDIVVAGRVVSSDVAGNFYNTFFIDDGTGAVEIMAGMPDLDATYRPGQRIVVRARGLSVGWSNGTMQMGLPPEAGSSFQTGYFYHPVVIGQYVSRGRDVEEVIPLALEVPELSTEICGRLVTIADLALDPQETARAWATTEPAPLTGYRKFYTADRRDSVTVLTSGYANFADRPLPTNPIALTGILLYGKGDSSREHFMIKLRNAKDITN
jgi:hypothetical protein